MTEYNTILDITFVTINIIKTLLLLNLLLTVE